MRGRCTELNLWTIAPDHDGGKFTTRCSPILDLPRPVHPVRGFLFGAGVAGDLSRRKLLWVLCVVLCSPYSPCTFCFARHVASPDMCLASRLSARIAVDTLVHLEPSPLSHLIR